MDQNFLLSEFMDIVVSDMTLEDVSDTTLYC